MKQTQIQSSNIKLLWGTRKPFLATLGLLVGASVLVFFFVVPQITQAYSYFTQWQEAQATEKSLKEKLQALSDTERAPEFRYETLVNTALPDRKPLLELMQSLAMLSQESNVNIDRFSLTPGLVATQAAESPSNTAESLDVEYSVSGSFEQLNAFMRRVEEVTPFTTIVSLGINTNNKDAEKTNFVANIKSETYFFAKSVVTGESTTLPKISSDAESVLQALQQYAPITVPSQSTIIGGEENPFGETLDILNGLN